MKRILSILIVTLLVISTTFGQKRIALTFDGNAHDCDDIGAIAYSLALVKKAQADKTVKLVYFAYKDHWWANHECADKFSNNCTTQNTELDKSYTDGKSKFYALSTAFYDAKSDKASAITALKNAINLSTSTDILYICCGGPWDLVYQAMAAANSTARKYVIVVTHSTWNDNHSDNVTNYGNTKKRSDFETTFGASLVKVIKDQNIAPWNGSTNYDWMKNITTYNLSWVRDRVVADLKWDASDAGLAWWVIKNSDAPTLSKVKTFFGNPTKSSVLDEKVFGTSENDVTFVVRNRSAFVDLKSETAQMVRIYDICGKSVVEKSVLGSSEIDLNGLNKGIYIIKSGAFTRKFSID